MSDHQKPDMAPDADPTVSSPDEDADDDFSYEDGGDFSYEALEVLCRVFDDGVDAAMEEWRAWYKPSEWMHPARGLGVFIRQRLLAKRELTDDERRSVEALHRAMQDASGTGRRVQITMAHANGIMSALATPASPTEDTR